MNAFCNELTASFFLPKRVNNFDPVGMLAGRRILWKLVEQVLQGGLEAGVSIDFSSGKRWVSTQRYYPPCHWAMASGYIFFCSQSEAKSRRTILILRSMCMVFFYCSMASSYFLE